MCRGRPPSINVHVSDTEMLFYSSTVDVVEAEVTNDAEVINETKVTNDAEVTNDTGNQPTTTLGDRAAVKFEGALTPRQVAQTMTGNFLKELNRSTKKATDAVEFYDSLPGCMRPKPTKYPDAGGVEVFRAGRLLHQEMEVAVRNYIKRLKEVGFLIEGGTVKEEGSTAPESSNNVTSAAVKAPTVADGALPSTTTSLAAPQKRKAPTTGRGSAKKRKASPKPQGPMQRLRFVNDEEESSSASECIRVRFRKVDHWNPDPCETCRMAGEKCSHFPFDIDTYTGDK